MRKVNKRNQEFPPTPKKSRVDSLGNDRRKMYHKDGGASMVLVKSITENQFKVVQNVIENILNDLGLKMEGTLIWKP